jgi:ribosomal protein S2
MKSSAVSQKQSQKNVQKQTLSMSSSLLLGYSLTKNVTKTVSHKPQAPYLTGKHSKKFKRYVKQGIKTALVSPLFHTACKVVVVIALVAGSVYVSYRFIGKTFANEVIVSQSEIVARVVKLTAVPQEGPEEIVRVQDPEVLKKQNEFYKNVKEGDYILMYQNLAIIYDLRSNRIVAIKRKEITAPKF